MKAVLASLILLAACEKPNDLARLDDVAAVQSKSAQRELDEFSRRIDEALRRGRTLVITPEAKKALDPIGNEANERMRELRSVFGPCAGPSDQRPNPTRAIPCPDHMTPFEKDVDAAIKAGDLDALGKVIDEKRELLDKDSVIINDRLTTIEDWVAQSAAQLTAPPQQPPTPPQPDQPAMPPPETPAEAPH